MKRIKDLPIPIQHQIKVAKKTLTMPDAILGVLGGMSKAEAEKLLEKYKEYR